MQNELRSKSKLALVCLVPVCQPLVDIMGGDLCAQVMDLFPSLAWFVIIYAV